MIDRAALARLPIMAAILMLAACSQQKKDPVDTTLPDEVVAAPESNATSGVSETVEPSQDTDIASDEAGEGYDPVGSNTEPSVSSVSSGARPLQAIQQADWVTTDDYPARSLREGVEGITSVRLSVGPSGRVEECEITESSGSAELDEATCRALNRRARFRAARDQDGMSIAATYSTRIRWVVPR